MNVRKIISLDSTRLGNSSVSARLLLRLPSRFGFWPVNIVEWMLCFMMMHDWEGWINYMNKRKRIASRWSFSRLMNDGRNDGCFMTDGPEVCHATKRHAGPAVTIFIQICAKMCAYMYSTYTSMIDRSNSPCYSHLLAGWRFCVPRCCVHKYHINYVMHLTLLHRARWIGYTKWFEFYLKYNNLFSFAVIMLSGICQAGPYFVNFERDGIFICIVVDTGSATIHYFKYLGLVHVVDAITGITASIHYNTNMPSLSKLTNPGKISTNWQ